MSLPILIYRMAISQQPPFLIQTNFLTAMSTTLLVYSNVWLTFLDRETSKAAMEITLGNLISLANQHGTLSQLSLNQDEINSQYQTTNQSGLISL